MRISRTILALVLFAGCGALTPPRTDAGSDAGPDAGATDAGGGDAGAEDAGADAGGTPDAGAPDAGGDAGEARDAGPCDGGFCAPELLTAERIDPWDLTVDGQHLYWLEYGLATNGLDGQVMKQRKDVVCLTRDAGCAVDLNTDLSGRFQVDTMTLAGDELCWTEHYANARNVVCLGLLSNAERTLASNQPGATEPVAVGGDLWWVNRGTSLAAQDGQVMWQARLDGAEAAVMVRGIPLAWALAVDEAYVYYLAQGTVTRLDGRLYRVRKHR